MRHQSWMLDKTEFLTVTFLAAIAGFVDAVGYLTLSHIYTANMSGNSVAIGIQLASQNWPEMLRRLWPVVVFVAGMLFCRILVEIGARQKFRYIVSVTTLCEIGLILPVFLQNSRHPAQTLYVALLAIAMGVQNAALKHVQSATVHTGFVTGVLLNSMVQLTKYLTWLYDHARKGAHAFGAAIAQSSKQKPFQLTLWLAFIWTAYVTGAVCGALGEHSFRFEALAAPIVGLLIVIAVDLKHPLATQEEKSQEEGS